MRRTPSKITATLPHQHALWLTAVVVSAQIPHLAHLPWWIGALGLASAGWRAACERLRRRPPPSWLLLTGGIASAIAIRVHFGYFAGREPCVAFLYLLIGLKLLEARQARDTTLLVCLAAFLTLTQYFYAQSFLAALASLPALLVIGATLIVVRDVGAPLPWRESLAGSGRFLLHGIPLAFIFFLLFPRISVPLWGMPSDAMGRTGLSESMSPDSIRDLSLSDDVAFRVDFEGDPPAPQLLYWRGPVLTRLDAHAWRTRLSAALASPIDSAGSNSIAYTVTLEPNNQRYYLALDLPTSIPAQARMTPQFELVGSAPITRQVRYRQTSVLRSQYNARPDPAINLQLPREGNPRTREWAQNLRNRYADDFTLATAILRQYHDDNFTYTLSDIVLGDNAIDDFLFDSKRGFCEHYASSFVFALRAAGIPARVVTGYQGGEMNDVGGLRYMIVHQYDAHAWAEAWIAGAWHRFDPTAAVAPERIEHGIGATLPRSEPLPFLSRLDDSWLRRFRLHVDALSYGWQRWVVGYSAERQRSLWSDAGFGDAQPWKLVLALTIGASFMGLVLAASILWRRARRDPAAAAWDRFCARLARAGLPRGGSEGPVAYSQRAIARWPTQAPILRQYAQIYCLLRYGDAPDRPDLHALLGRLQRRLPSTRALRTA